MKTPRYRGFAASLGRNLDLQETYDRDPAGYSDALARITLPGWRKAGWSTAALAAEACTGLAAELSLQENAPEISWIATGNRRLCRTPER
ncbi:MAG: hypothetical protein MJ114_01915, partial [Acetatifactor sp.]|nr:hypothetical protein [Acetatifactor sp.]